MTDPIISIVIPTLNSEKTLQIALDSLMNQQFANFEIWIIDSVSRDRTLSIAAENAEKDSRIRVFSEPDKGVYDAMNKGIERARGQWILFMGSDDRLYDEKVLHSFFSGSGLARNPGHLDFDLVYGNVVSPSYKGVYDGEFSFEKLLRRNIPHQAVFYKKSIFGLIGPFAIHYKGYADWDLNIRCFKDNRVRVQYIDLIVAYFGADGISSRHDIPFLRQVLIPEKLRMLHQAAIHSLRPLKAYDEWWRLLRNAEVRDLSTLREYANGEKIPVPVGRMVAWQQKIPARLLRVGLFSKFTMFVNYICNLLTASL
jgi:glycosyltransferase involved in cell wall biosynthesis